MGIAHRHAEPEAWTCTIPALYNWASSNGGRILYARDIVTDQKSLLAGRCEINDGSLAGTSSFGMSGVNAHLLLAHKSPAQQPIDTAPMPWHRDRFFIAPKAHSLLAYAHATSQQQASFSFRLTAAAMAGLFDSRKNGRLVLPGPVLLHMAAVTAATLHEGCNSVAVSEVAFPSAARLPEQLQLSAMRVAVLEVQLVAGRLAVISNQQHPQSHMRGTWCQVPARQLQQAKSMPKSPDSILARLFAAPDAASHKQLLACLDESPLEHLSLDHHSALLTSALSSEQPDCILASAGLYIHEPAKSRLQMHVQCWGTASVDTQMTSHLQQGSCVVSDARYRPAGASAGDSAGHEAEKLTYRIESQVAAAAPADLSLICPPGKIT